MRPLQALACALAIAGGLPYLPWWLAALAYLTLVFLYFNPPSENDK
jgi:hypothetical protein